MGEFPIPAKPRKGQGVTKEPENLGKASGLVARRHVEKKECDRRDGDERSSPGDPAERVYEPVSLVESACKPAWFPLCLQAGVTRAEECPGHTVGVCGCFSAGQAVNHRVSLLQSSAPHARPHPQQPQTGRDKAFLGSGRANPPGLGALSKPFGLLGTWFLSCDMERACDPFPSLF